MPVAIAVASLAVAAVGTGVSIYQGQQAAAVQNKALTLQQQSADNQNAQQQRAAIRQSRVAYANAQQNSENQGASQSSSSQGGLASIQTQLDANLSFLDDQAALAKAAGQAEGQANIFKQKQETFNQIADLGFKVFGASGGFNSAAKTATTSAGGSWDPWAGVTNDYGNGGGT